MRRLGRLLNELPSNMLFEAARSRAATSILVDTTDMAAIVQMIPQAIVVGQRGEFHTRMR